VQGDAQPGPGRWERIDWLLAALLGLLAAALRWPFLGAPAYGDEAMHFYMAKHLLATPTNFSDVFGQTWFHPSWIVYQRPLYYLLFHPAALLSFHAFRLQNLAAGALLPALAYGLLRAWGVRRPFAAGLGAACAALPYLVVWGTFGLMDTTMTDFLLAALWARAVGRGTLSAALFLAAIWSKETAYFAAAAQWGVGHLARWRRGEPLWPLRMDRAQSALALVLLVGLWPLMVSFSHGLQTPGGTSYTPNAYVLEEVFWSALLVPVLLLGLRWPASRGPAAWAFYVLLHALLHRSVEIWYEVPSVTLTLVGTAATLDAAWTAAAPSRRWAPALGAVAVAGLLASGVLVPDGAAKAWLHPVHHVPSGSYADSLRYETQVRDNDLKQLQGLVAQRPAATLFFFDVAYTEVLYPFSEQHPHLLVGASGWFPFIPHPLGPVAQAVEANGTLTVVQERPGNYNQAMRDVYADCVVERNPTYVVIEGWRCKGRAAQLEQQVPYPSHA
jgi:hypothetical protein